MTNIAMLAQAENETPYDPDGHYLFHFAWVPDFETRITASILSSDLNTTSYKNSIYELGYGATERWIEADLESAHGHTIFTGKDSWPHVTYAHAFMTADEAASVLTDIFETLELFPKHAKTTLEIGGVGFYSALPRFLGTKDQHDDAAWVTINKTRQMCDLQEVIVTPILQRGLKVVTGLGEKWNPHITLACEPCELQSSDQKSFRQQRAVPSGQYDGILVVGLAGPNGQLRTVARSIVSRGKTAYLPGNHRNVRNHLLARIAQCKEVETIALSKR